MAAFWHTQIPDAARNIFGRYASGHAVRKNYTSSLLAMKMKRMRLDDWACCRQRYRYTCLGGIRAATQRTNLIARFPSTLL
jgi:hypothetical protein